MCFSAVLSASFLLGCGDASVKSASPQDGREGQGKSPTSIGGEGGAVLVPKEDAIDSAAKFAIIYFRTIEEEYGTKVSELENGYFNQPDFKPRAEFDSNSSRWRVWFSNGLPGAGFCIEMSASGKRGTLVTLSGRSLAIAEPSEGPSDQIVRPRFSPSEFRDAIQQDTRESED